MKKKLTKLFLATFLGLSLAAPTVVSAGTWHGSTITLPRAGTTWWASVTRKATSNTQGLKASRNKYQVVGNIANSGNKIIGNGWKTFNAYNKHAQYSKTYAKGSRIKAVFQTNRYNLHTVQAYLEWRP